MRHELEKPTLRELLNWERVQFQKLYLISTQWDYFEQLLSKNDFDEMLNEILDQLLEIRRIKRLKY